MSDDNSGCTGVLTLAGIAFGIYLIFKLIAFLFKGVVLVFKMIVFGGYNFIFYMDSLMFIQPINPIILWGIMGLFIGSLVGILIAIKKYRLSKKLVLYPIGLMVTIVLIMSFINRPLKYSTAHYQSDFNKIDKSLEPIDPVKSSTIDEVQDKSIIGIYSGTIGEKIFKLRIDKFDGENIYGYNITGTNKRSVKGKIARKWAKEKDGQNYTVFNLILSEPGNDKWDGEFDIDIWIADKNRIGEGIWKAYNGKLERNIKIVEGKRK